MNMSLSKERKKKKSNLNMFKYQAKNFIIL